jgi:hypothetical protein
MRYVESALLIAEPIYPSISDRIGFSRDDIRDHLIYLEYDFSAFRALTYLSHQRLSLSPGSLVLAHITQYTLANYKFSEWLEPDNEALKKVGKQR